VIFFGWNDHWIAYDTVDAEKQMVVRTDRVDSFIKFVYQKSRILQAGHYLLSGLGRGSTGQLKTVRVPLEHYAKNLHAMAEVFEKANDVPVVFVTAPTSHYGLGVPDYLVKDKFIADKEFAMRMHRQYNDVVRKVARDHDAYLIDMEAEFESMSASDLKAMFTEDGIHFTDLGRAVLSQRIASALRERVIPHGVR
jgi:lysophospholipase L1-like esterase